MAIIHLPRSILSIILVILVLTTITPVTSAETSPTKEQRTPVDPTIALTSAYLPMLQIASIHVKDQQIRTLILSLISTINTKGTATSADIQAILKSHRFGFDIRSGLLQSEGMGGVLCFPGFCPSFNGYRGPVCIGTWEGTGYTRAGPTNYSDCRGWFLGYIGYVKNEWWTGTLRTPPFQYRELLGISALIIIQPYA